MKKYKTVEGEILSLTEDQAREYGKISNLEPLTDDKKSINEPSFQEAPRVKETK